MKKLLWITLLLAFSSSVSYAQSVKKQSGKIEVNRLMDSLWIHPASFLNHNDPNWIRLNQHLQYIDILQLNDLIHSIYFGSTSFMLNRSHANDGFIGILNRSDDAKKTKEYHRKIREGFRDPKLYPNHKVVLIEGDSWFEYPIFLKDISDYLEKKPNLAIYTIAHGGDWVANMISNLQYEYDYVKVKPDVFIISGGGNDLVGGSRLSNFILLKPLSIHDPYLKNYRNYVLLRMLKKPASICSSGYCKLDNPAFSDSLSFYKTKIDTNLMEQIVTGRRYLSQNFYRFLVTIKFEY
ncbi:MAG: SGNH/GDSL hydrolase family protein, partial [Bacteroidales bacterium]|nr:SGNH/GDSL hydrolase family protein [Bacteroidales bacterium]